MPILIGGRRILLILPILGGSLVQIFDLVFENKKVRRSLAGQADEGSIIVLNNALHFLVIIKSHRDRGLIVDQLLNVLDLLVGTFRRSRMPSLRRPSQAFQAIDVGYKTSFLSVHDKYPFGPKVRSRASR